MIEGCKHGPTDLVPQPCVDCERERLSREGATHRFAERLSELAPLGGTDDKNAPASALPDVPTVGDLDATSFRFRDDAFNLGEPRYPKTLTPYTLKDRIAQWREQATFTPGNLYEEGRANAFDRCADELDAALRACAEAPAPTDKAIDRIIQTIAELPDRTSPEDWPDAMLVTADELRAILGAELRAAAPAPADPTTDRRVWCGGCGTRWTSPEGFLLAGVVHLCGDCWRKVQPTLHSAAALAPSTDTAEPHETNTTKETP